MRTVDIREVLTATVPKKSDTHVEEIVGQLLGDVSVEQLVLAAHSTKDNSDSSGVTITVPVREIYQEAEEE